MAIITPYNTDYMVWDEVKKQYTLTKDAIQNLLNVNLDIWAGSPEDADLFLEEMSDDIYLYIYSYSNLNNKSYKEYILGCVDTLRDIIQRAMIFHSRASIRSGLFLIKDQHGVNIEKGMAIDLKQIRGDVTISSQSKQILMSSGILYTGTYPYLQSIEDEWWVIN